MVRSLLLALILCLLLAWVMAQVGEWHYWSVP